MPYQLLMHFYYVICWLYNTLSIISCSLYYTFTWQLLIIQHFIHITCSLYNTFTCQLLIIQYFYMSAVDYTTLAMSPVHYTTLFPCKLLILHACRHHLFIIKWFSILRLISFYIKSCYNILKIIFYYNILLKCVYFKVKYHENPIVETQGFPG